MVKHTLFNWYRLGVITGPTLMKLKYIGKTDSVRMHHELVDEAVVAVLALVDGDGDYTNSNDLDTII